MKNTAETESEEIPTPKKVIISMQQHIGAACEPIVKKGDLVTVGQLIADSQSFMCAPIHSGVSGVVTNIGTIIMPNGAEIKTIEIESDGEQTVCPDIEPPVITNADELYSAVRKSGLVGLGGAGFPVSIKLNFSPEKKVDTLVINGAECEPYLTADYREMMEFPEDIIEGTRFVMETLGLRRSIIGIEGNKPAAIRRLDEIIRERSLDDKMCVLKLGTSYPHGAEKVLIKACTNRAVPVGKIPADAGCVVLNITSVSFIAKYVRTGMPLVSKRITVDGSAIENPKNVIAPIGTMISDIAEFCGGFKQEPKKVLMGGPMMGTALYTLDYPIIKQNNGLIFMGEKEADDVKLFLFVWAGAGEAKFYDITQPDALRPGVSEERMTEYRRFLSARQWLVPLAVALFVASPFMYSSYYGMVIIPVTVAVGVGILIIVGSVHGTYSDVRADKQR